MEAKGLPVLGRERMVDREELQQHREKPLEPVDPQLHPRNSQTC